MSAKTSTGPSVAIVGAGIIGLSCAWELTKRGADVTLYEKTWPPRGASWAAAGMLAPAYEAATELGAHPRLFDLCMASAGMWAEYAAELESVSGMDVGYHAGPTLAVAMEADQARPLDALKLGLVNYGVANAEPSDSKALETIFVLAGEVGDVVRISTDGHVDNRRVLEALIKVVPSPQPPSTSALSGTFDHVLQTNGWVNGHCNPVKGQLISVAKLEGDPSLPIRAKGIYIVPKQDRVIIGATVEPGLVDTDTDLDVAERLYDRAIKICPHLSGRDITEHWAGVRPVTADHAPVFTGAPGMWSAVGHGRNGILLAPVTAKIMADMILDGEVGDLAAAFSPDRFLGETG